MRIFRGTHRIGFALVVVAATVGMAGSAWSNDDVTPPSVNIVTPANGANYALNSTVNANYSCSDSSGIAACVGTASNGAPIQTQKVGPKTFSVSGYDNAGNKTKVERTYNVVDTTGPVITISSPANNASYPKNSNLRATFSCYDTGVGIQSCVGTVSNGSNVPTNTVGNKQFTVTAKDLSNNQTIKVVNYTIV